MKHIIFRKNNNHFTVDGEEWVVGDVQIVGKFAYVFSVKRALVAKYPAYLVNIVK